MLFLLGVEQLAALLLLVLLLLATSTTTTALECNICGEGNEIGNGDGVVTINYDGTPRKQSCTRWQDSKLISEEWCEENMVQYTRDICKCIKPDGSLLKDDPVPTASPAPTVGGWTPPEDGPELVGPDGEPIVLGDDDDSGSTITGSMTTHVVLLTFLAAWAVVAVVSVAF